jgi:GAF domain
VSEELENSLQQAIESYLGKRLGAIDEQLSRLQSDFDEALKRLRESSANDSLTATPLSAAIFAHLQTARSQRLSGASPERARSSGEVAIIKRAVEEIERQQSHADILGSLLTGAAQFAERAALFVIRNEQAIGWRECEAGDPANFELIGGVSLPLSADTLLGRAAHSRSTWNGAPGSNSEDSLLIDQLGGDPQTVAAVPLVVRGKVVAVLYADSVSHDSNAVNVDALELLARVAAMAVNLASAPRAVPEPQTDEPEAVTPTAVAEPAYTPEIEPQTAEVIAAPVVEEVSTEPTADHVPEVIASPAVEEVSAQREPGPLARPEEAAAETSAPKPITAAPAIETAAPSFTTQYAAPLGSARRYGVSEPDLPIDVGEEERRLHNDARRFARLLVSEIKLYNEPKVKDGRSNGDLYDRLREDIDRSRQMYNKRVAPPVAARHDYFHQELVNTLAEGDPAKLGDSYPGAAVAVN